MTGEAGRPQSFPQSDRLKRPQEFRRVFDGGRKAVGRFFVVFSRANSGSRARLGLAVSRKVGNAVCRNRIKRVVREHFRQSAAPGPMDLVVVARTAAARADRQALAKDLHSLWKRVRDA